MLEYDIGLDGEKREIGGKDVVKEEMDEQSDMWTDPVSQRRGTMREMHCPMMSYWARRGGETSFIGLGQSYSSIR